MGSSLHQINRPALVGLAHALKAGRIALPCYVGAIRNYVPDPLAAVVTEELNRLYAMGMVTELMAHTLSLLAEERSLSQQRQDRVDIVWTGEEVLGTESRDTYVVVQEIFKLAQESVLIASYALDDGKKGQNLFKTLAEKLDAIPTFQVRMFLNVKRSYLEKTPSSVLLRGFSEHFRQKVWPGQRLPDVFYDPRSLTPSSLANACLHAKCVVVDEERLLVTSANFTEAAHLRNIEAGVLVSDRVAAKAIRSQFEMLLTKGFLLRVPGL